MPGGYRYEQLCIPSPKNDGKLWTTTPPLPGDKVNLSAEGAIDVYRVLERQWRYPSPGSMAWQTHTQPDYAGTLTIIVEPAPGVFVDEVRSEEHG